MMREVNTAYAAAFREGPWIVRLQLAYLLLVPFVAAACTAWLIRWL